MIMMRKCCMLGVAVTICLLQQIEAFSVAPRTTMTTTRVASSTRLSSAISPNQDDQPEPTAINAAVESVANDNSNNASTTTKDELQETILGFLMQGGFFLGAAVVAYSLVTALLAALGDLIVYEAGVAADGLQNLASFTAGLAWQGVQTAAPMVGHAVMEAGKAATPYVQDAAQQARQAATPYVEQATTALGQAAAPYMDSVSQAVDSAVVAPLLQTTQSVTNAVDSAVVEPIQGAADTVTSAVDATVLAPLQEAGDSVNNAVDAVASKMPFKMF